MNPIGAHLCSLREAAGLSLREMAERTTFSVMWLAVMELGPDDELSGEHVLIYLKAVLG